MPVTGEQVRFFEKLRPQLVALQAEMSILSKSKPDNPLNKFKLRHVNQLLADANTLLVGEHVPLKGFSQFDEDSMPSNSDVVFVLSQYIEGLEGWRSAHVKKSGYEWYWDTTGRGASIKTERPSRFKRDDD